jgi:hypothetical protein
MPGAGPSGAEMTDRSGPVEGAPDDREFHTETFSNARGWTAVRVTHVPTGAAAERARTDGLRSAVQAQRECIEELRAVLSAGVVTLTRDRRHPEGEDATDFELLLREIADLRRRLNELEDEVRRMKGIGQPASSDPDVTQ